MYSENKSTEDEVQTILNTTGLPFLSLKYNQYKLKVRCDKLRQPLITILPDLHLRLNYEYADWFLVQITL
jgi:hypothetical protein